jgi:hypothetical protein
LRRLMFMLSLIAALAGTPLRMAEAAHDFARSVAETGCGDVMEEPDGGVGDDSDATIKAETTHAPDTNASASILPGCPGLPLPPSWAVLKQLADPPPRPVAKLPQRLARLQCFLC